MSRGLKLILGLVVGVVVLNLVLSLTHAFLGGTPAVPARPRLRPEPTAPPGLT